MATASNGTYAEDVTVPTSAGSGNAGSGFANNTSAQSSTGPEEVGWYFVQQYYTTLNKTPERLHVSFHPTDLSIGIVNSFFVFEWCALLIVNMVQ